MGRVKENEKEPSSIQDALNKVAYGADGTSDSTALKRLVKNIDQAGSLEQAKNERWGASDVSALLSRICLLENQNAASFLPRRKSTIDEVIKRAGGRKDDYMVVVWNSGPKSEDDSRRLQTYPATFSVMRNGAITIDISSAATISRDQELMFAGELFVSPCLPSVVQGKINQNTLKTGLQDARNAPGAGVCA